METVAASREPKVSGALFSNSKFMRLWLSSVFTGLSLSVCMLAETWYVVDVLQLSSMLGIVLMATTLPRVLLTIYGGVLVDRFSASTIMFFSTAIRGFLMALVVVALFMNLFNIWVMIGFSLLYGILDAFFWPANGSIIPAIVHKDHLSRANSIIETTSKVTFFCGPLLAGWLIAFASYSFIFGSVGLLLILGGLLVHKLNSSQAKKQSSNSIWADLKEGFTYVKSVPILLSSMLMGVIINLCLTGPGNLAAPIIVSQKLGGDAIQLSYVESATAIGMVIGGFVIGIWNPRKRRGVISLTRLLILGATFVLFSQVTTLWQCIAAAGMIGFLITSGDLAMRSLSQEIIEPDKRGRVSGINSSIGQGLVPLSFALTSFVLSLGISIFDILLVCGIGMMFYTLLGFWKFKALRQAN